MQMTAQKKVAKKKGGGLSRLKTGKKADLAEPEEEKKGGDSGEAQELREEIERLKSEIQATRAAAASSAEAAEDLDSMPVLGYWAIRGLAAPIRMMFYYCKA